MDNILDLVNDSLRRKKADEFCAQRIGISLDQYKDLKNKIFDARELIQDDFDKLVKEIVSNGLRKDEINNRIGLIEEGSYFTLDGKIDSSKTEAEPKSGLGPKRHILSAYNSETGNIMNIEEYCKYYGFPYEDVSTYKFLTYTGTPCYNITFKDIMSAWDAEKKQMMSIDTYCQTYNLERSHIASFKLVSHTGNPYFNILFREIINDVRDLTEDFIDAAIAKHVREVQGLIPQLSGQSDEWFDVAILSDAHIGMDTDKDGIALYATPWNKKEQLRRAMVFVNEVIAAKKGTEIYINELGDLMDGYNAMTVRGGHELPQNMSNEEAFDTAIDFKMYIIDHLVRHYEMVHLHNICNDNHAGSFGYMVNSTIKKLCAAKYPNQVVIYNHRQFINHYIVGKHAFVITHGKDSKALKFGFKPKLDAVQIEKIDSYLKYHKIYQRAEYIEFAKGDSHQALFDYCTSDDFCYFNYPAFSPASEWIQTNFKKGRSGFVMQNVKYNENVKDLKTKWF